MWPTAQFLGTTWQPGGWPQQKGPESQHQTSPVWVDGAHWMVLYCLKSSVGQERAIGLGRQLTWHICAHFVDSIRKMLQCNRNLQNWKSLLLSKKTINIILISSSSSKNKLSFWTYLNTFRIYALIDKLLLTRRLGSSCGQKGLARADEMQLLRMPQFTKQSVKSANAWRRGVGACNPGSWLPLSI